MYAMVSGRALNDFRTQIAVGVKRPQLARDAFSNPPGAFDAAMPEQLSSSVRKGLDALSRDSQRLVRDYLHKRLGRDQELDDEEDNGQFGRVDIGAGDLGEQVVELLEGAGVDPQIVERVKAMVAASRGDGTLRLSDQEGMAPLGGYDTTSGTAGGLLTGDEPPAFRGEPRVGGGQVPYTSSGDAERHRRAGKHEAHQIVHAW
jgi:hypothetical protein